VSGACVSSILFSFENDFIYSLEKFPHFFMAAKTTVSAASTLFNKESMGGRINETII
jgi:hypothetical protein